MKLVYVLRCFVSLSVLCLALGANTASAQVLALDFDELDVAGGVPLTEPGFQSFTIDTANAVVTEPVTRIYGAISATVASSNATFGFDDRQRATPTNSGDFTTENLLRDFVFSRATGFGVTDGLDLTLTGLAPRTPYIFTIWSFDSGSAGNRVSDWFANGVELVSDYAFDGRVLPTTDTQQRFSFTASTDASGQIIIGARRDDASVDGIGAASFGVFLNALQVDVIPEPTTAMLLAAGCGVCLRRRRR